MNTSILVVDDDDAHRGMLRMMLQAWGYSVDEAADGDLAVEAVRAKPYDVVLTDVRMGRMDGIHALRGILDYNPALPVVLMTAYSSVETAVDALRLGAYDYLTKPLDFDALRETLQRAVDHSRMSVENRELRRQLSEAAAGPEILGRSPAVSAMREIIATVAPTEATVLITGESGTGKELVARAVHGASARANKPLVTVNCAALAENLLESELFGHERGAFTGADRRREGRFLQADGGTLFLDEIGEMPLSLQAKLLRALQQGEVQRVGSDSPITVDVRVIAATNRNLREEVEQKRFREENFHIMHAQNISPTTGFNIDYKALNTSYSSETYQEDMQKKYKWVEYHKWKFKARTFTALSSATKCPVLMTRVEFGLLGHYNKYKKSPFETFYMGGDGMTGYSSTYATETIGLRGYENGSLTPYGYEGYAYSRMTLELRYPVMLEASTQIYALAFAEGGNAWTDVKKFNPFNMKRSAGVGVRIFLPMIGLMGIDWGYGFDKVFGRSDYGGSQFHFIIGQEF